MAKQLLQHARKLLQHQSIENGFQKYFASRKNSSGVLSKRTSRAFPFPLLLLGMICNEYMEIKIETLEQKFALLSCFKFLPFFF